MSEFQHMIALYLFNKSRYCLLRTLSDLEKRLAFQYISVVLVKTESYNDVYVCYPSPILRTAFWRLRRPPAWRAKAD